MNNESKKVNDTSNADTNLNQETSKETTATGLTRTPMEVLFKGRHVNTTHLHVGETSLIFTTSQNNKPDDTAETTMHYLNISKGR